MKTLNKRSKILLGLGALVVVVVVAGIVLLEPGGVSLFGGTVIHISPQNPTINVDQTLDMSINSVGNCTWSSSNPAVADINYWFLDTSRQATIMGMGPGQATIKANCWMNRYTTVTVRTPPVISPSNPTVGVGKTVTLSTGNPSCTWYEGRYGLGDISISPTTGASTVVTGVKVGMRNIKVSCDNGPDSGDVTIQ